MYINGDTIPDGTATCGSPPCSSITINWTTTLAVPDTYSFVVETDDGSNVLAEGAETFAVGPGTNDFTSSPILMDGVAAEAAYGVATDDVTCDNTSSPGSCSGDVTISDADGNSITSTSLSVGAGGGTSGNAFDNGPVNVAVANDPSAQTGTIGTLTTPASGTIGAVSSLGTYPFTVSCNSSTTTGTFDLTFGDSSSSTGTGAAATGANTSGSTTPAYPSLTYPSIPAGSASGETPNFTCVSGVIYAATGSVTAQ